MWGIVPGKGHETGRWHAAAATHAPKWAITAATVETRAAVEAPAGRVSLRKRMVGFWPESRAAPDNGGLVWRLEPVGYDGAPNAPTVIAIQQL